MEGFIRYLMAQDLSRKTLKDSIDNVWVLGGTVIKDSMYKRHNKDQRQKILEEVEYGGCLPEHFERMSERELASFERRCKKFEKFLKSQESLSGEKTTRADKKRLPYRKCIPQDDRIPEK